MSINKNKLFKSGMLNFKDWLLKFKQIELYDILVLEGDVIEYKLNKLYIEYLDYIESFIHQNNLK